MKTKLQKLEVEYEVLIRREAQYSSREIFNYDLRTILAKLDKERAKAKELRFFGAKSIRHLPQSEWFRTLK